MGTMIPKYLSPEIKSNAERKIFEWFRDDPNTSGWFILHSLGIANHKTVLYGEIDFLVIAPKLGVFALEVKGGRVRRENGIWIFTNKYGNESTKRRGPFEQANEGIFSIFHELKRKCGVNSSLAKILFGSGVMFPDIEFRVTDLDAEQWQVFDKNDKNNVIDYIKRMSKNCKRKWEEKYGPMPAAKLPDSKTARELANFLRGDFDLVPPWSIQINYTEEELIALTNEQLRCLDQLEDNPRCLIQGPAGTGKTLLAIEHVKKSAIVGKKVAFFCFNKLLGNWLRNYFSQLPTVLQPAFIGTFHAYMFQTIKDSQTDNLNNFDDKHQFFSEDMPLLTLDVLENYGILFDEIIIDEAQDLLKPDYLDVIDASLKNGLERGNWYFFGDFNRQAIFNNISLFNMKELLEERTSFINYKLKINCRNTKPIGEEIKLITGFDSSEYLSVKAQGLPVNYYKIDENDSGVEKLEMVLDRLFKDGISPEKITILSPRKKRDSVCAMTKKHQILDYETSNKDNVTFSTIHSFKGLENSVIILIDIDTYEYEQLMYVGLSRARSALFIIETQNAYQERLKLKTRWI